MGCRVLLERGKKLGRGSRVTAARLLLTERGGSLGGGALPPPPPLHPLLSCRASACTRPRPQGPPPTLAFYPCPALFSCLAHGPPAKEPTAHSGPPAHSAAATGNACLWQRKPALPTAASTAQRVPSSRRELGKGRGSTERLCSMHGAPSCERCRATGQGDTAATHANRSANRPGIVRHATGLLAAPPPSWRTVLPAAPAGSASVVAPAGLAVGAPCPLVPGERILLRNQPLAPHVGVCSAAVPIA